MAAKRNGLGKGLDAMIPNKMGELKGNVSVGLKEGKPSEDMVVLININRIEPNKDQPRKTFDEDSINELADSIKQYGVLTPLLVQKRDDYYEIIAGERRWRASKKAGLKELPVIIKDLPEQEIVEIALIENIQRVDLNPIEEALTYKRLKDEYNLTQDEIAVKVSKSRVTITNSMRLLKLDERVQQMLIEEIINSGSARALLTISDNDKQYELAQRILDEGLNVRDVEKEVKKLTKGKKDTKKSEAKIDSQTEAIYTDLEEQMKSILGTKVSINAKDAKQGKVEIEYYSQDELNRLLELFQTIQK